jgi:hypothetical protein
VDLFDDRGSAVGLVGRDGVEDGWVGGGEEGVEPSQVEQCVLAGGAVLIGVEVRDPAHHHQPVRDLVGLLFRGERGELDLGDLGPGPSSRRVRTERTAPTGTVDSTATSPISPTSSTTSPRRSDSCKMTGEAPLSLAACRHTSGTGSCSTDAHAFTERGRLPGMITGDLDHLGDDG